MNITTKQFQILTDINLVWDFLVDIYDREYNQWIGMNRGKYQLFINTENRTPHETAETIAAFITGWTEERRSHG